MARKNRGPFYWRDGWYVKVRGINGKRSQRRIGDTLEQAQQEWAKMLLTADDDSPRVKIVTLAALFMRWVEAHQSAATIAWYSRYLGPWTAAKLDLTIDRLKPYHLTDWIDQQKLPTSAQRATITAVKRMLNWSVEKGRIVYNPLAKVRRPAAGRREQLVPVDAHQAMAAVVDGSRGGPGVNKRTGKRKRSRDGAFRAVLIALKHSGARPEEVRTVEARQFDADARTWTFEKHKTSGRTGRKRVVYLTPCVVALCRALAAIRPTGPLFLNALGKPWTGGAIRCRMKRMRERLGLPAGTVAYSYRHTFTTDAMTRGVDTSMVAALLGHRDSTMIDKHYGHLDQRGAELQKALERAVSTQAAT